MPTFGPGVQVIASGCGYLLLDTHALKIRGVPSRQCQEKRMDQGAMGWAKRSVWRSGGDGVGRMGQVQRIEIARGCTGK